MGKIAKRFKRVFLLSAALLLAIATPALAFLDNPNSMTIENIRWFQNLAADGDMACIFHFNIDYDSYPDTPASDTIVFRLYDTDGETLLAANSPYAYVLFKTNGYGDGVSSFYIPAGSNMTWGESYKINIYGLPAYFSGLDDYIIDIAAADWSTADTDSESQKGALYDYILELCDDFKTIYTDVPLKAATDGEFTLSPYGEGYFTGAIPGIYSMCPQLFFSQIYVPTTMATENYTLGLGEEYGKRLEDTDLGRGAERVGAVFGVPGEFFWGFWTVVLSIAACIWTMRKGWGIESGMLISAGLVILAAVLVGNWMFTLVMVGMLAAAIAIFWILHLKRAT